MVDISQYGKENLKVHLLYLRKNNTRNDFYKIVKRELGIKTEKSLTNALRRRGITNDFLKWELLL